MHFIALLFQKDDKEFTVAVFSNSAPVTLNFLTLEVLQLDACELRLSHLDFCFCFDLPKLGSSAADFCQNSVHFVNKNSVSSHFWGYHFWGVT